MTIVHQSTCLSKGAFHTSTFGVLPAHERLAIATKALRDLAREQRKRAKHAAEVRRLRSNWRLMQATYGGSIFRYEPDEEGDAAA
jgi:hypothetical protein